MNERIEQMMTVNAREKFFILQEIYKSKDPDIMDQLEAAGAFNVIENRKEN